MNFVFTNLFYESFLRIWLFCWKWCKTSQFFCLARPGKGVSFHKPRVILSLIRTKTYISKSLIWSGCKTFNLNLFFGHSRKTNNADKIFLNRQNALGVDFEHYLTEPSGISQVLLRFQLPFWLRWSIVIESGDRMLEIRTFFGRRTPKMKVGMYY